MRVDIAKKLKTELEVVGIGTVATLTNYSIHSVRWKVARARKGLCDFVLPLDGKKGEKMQFLRAAVEDWILRRHEKSNPNNNQFGAEQISPETVAKLANHGLTPK